MTLYSVFEIFRSTREVTEFINKLCVCDIDVISPEELISYESLVQEVPCDYCNIVNSKRWEQATGKNISQDQPSLPKAYTVVIDNSVNKD